MRDGRVHRASDLAAAHKVSVRTLYRDMETLKASGLPIRGDRGTGYRAEKATALPSLTLSEAELEVLQLGIAIVSEATDPDLKQAAQSLADKIDAALPTTAPPTTALPTGSDWLLASYPFADAARGFAHLSPIRAAIRGRQKLRVATRQPDGQTIVRTLRPLELEHWGRIWMLTAWCDEQEEFAVLRTDMIDTATPLPELFVDEPGKRLEDYRAVRS